MLKPRGDQGIAIRRAVALVSVGVLSCDAPSANRAGVDDLTVPQVEAGAAQRALTDLARYPSLGLHLTSSPTAAPTELRGVARAQSSLSVTLPERANGALYISKAGQTDLWISITAEGLSGTAATTIGNATVFPGAAIGTDVIQVQEPDRIEEVRLLRTASAPAIASYLLRVGPGLATVRARDGRIEAVDAKGYVHFGTAPAFAIDAVGTRRELTTQVQGWDGTYRAVLTLDKTGLVLPIAIDPAWSTVASMLYPRSYHTATVIGSKVIVTGGNSGRTGPETTAESYDPSTNVWTLLPYLVQARYDHFAAPVGAGKIFLVGGVEAPTSAELYHPAGTSVAAASPKSGHQAGTLSVLTSGKFLLVAGVSGSSATSAVELYDPATGAWTDAAALPTARNSHAAVVLPSGRVLVTGGASGAAPLSDAQLYEPITNKWYPAAPLNTGRYAHGAVLLASGKVLVAGGFDASTADISTAEIYDPTANTWTTLTSKMSAPRHSVTPVLTGSLAMVAGGAGNPSASDGYSSVELFDPSSNTFSLGAPMASHRSYHTVSVLPGGAVLAVGGDYPGATVFAVSTAELYNPAPNCVLDSDCPSGDYCAAPLCAPKLTGAAACARDAMCATGHCADGVCCDRACTGSCEACTAAFKGSGSDGTCANVATGTNPRGKCALDPGFPASCKADGACDGAGACRPYAPAGTACGATSCAAGKISGKTCDGAGTCTTGASTACDPYACDAAGDACLKKCTTDGQCAAGYVCIGSACSTKLALGLACTRDTECASGSCVDGVCCDSPCGADCQACTAALKGSGTDGTCADVPADTNPRGRCVADPGYPGSCKGDGLCDGAGSCRTYAKASTACGAVTCTGGVVNGLLCDGAGTCKTSTGTSCAPYVCNAAGSACLTTCVGDTDCIASATCTGGVCTSKVLKSNGQACSAGTECNTGHCADSVCCDTACDGQCAACDLKGSEGTCSAVTGAPHAGRVSCGDPSTPCVGQCDGKTQAACTYPATTVSCGASCANGSVTTKTCDGKGACVTKPAVDCGGFACDGATACKKTCASNSDCLTGFVCSNNACLSGDALVVSNGSCGCQVPGRGAGSAAAASALLAMFGLIGVRRRTGVRSRR